MRLFRPVFFGKLLYTESLFRIKTDEKVLCLTFDDGPAPESTPRLLEILDNYKIKAIFFCTGYAAETYPVLMDLIKSKGHVVGNHGYNHLNGWKTSLSDYNDDVRRSTELTSSVLFRPPYGRIRPAQYKSVVKTFNVVFWDLMPYDFDRNWGGERCLKILKKKMRPGSVIVLHDKVSSSIFSFLDEFIISALDEGYRFVIPSFSGKEQTRL